MTMLNLGMLKENYRESTCNSSYLNQYKEGGHQLQELGTTLVVSDGRTANACSLLLYIFFCLSTKVLRHSVEIDVRQTG